MNPAMTIKAAPNAGHERIPNRQREIPLNMTDQARMSPAISIVVPVYNVGPYLCECLDSVLAQTFADWECICVDDGSTDNSPEILRDYAAKDSRFRIVRQSNGGLSAARNSGMDAASGIYLYFLDSDDALAMNALEKLHALAEKKDLDEILFGTHLAVEGPAASGKQVADMRHYYEIPETIAGRTMSGAELFTSLIDVHAFFASVPLRFFRRASIPPGLRFPEGLLHEDNYFSPLALLAAKRAVSIPDKLYRRRIRAQSITTSEDLSKRRANDMLAIYHALGKAEKIGAIPRKARPAFAEFRRELYRVHLHGIGRKRNAFARLVDIQRAVGFRSLTRTILRKLTFQ